MMRIILIAAIWFTTTTLQAAPPPESAPLGGQDGVSYSVAYSPDGKVLATGGKDGTLIFWDADGRFEINRIKAHEGPIYAITFTPDGGCALTGSQDKTLRVWDVKTAKEKQPSIQSHDDAIMAIAINKDASLIASAGWDGKVKICDNKGAPKGEHNLHAGPVFAVAFAPEGDVIVSGGRDRLIKFWNIADKKEIGEIKGLERTIYALAYLPDGKSLVSASGNMVKLWDLANKTSKGEGNGHLAAVRSIALSADGKVLVSTGEDSKIIRWDTDKMSALDTIDVGAGFITDVALSSDATRLAIASADSARSVRSWKFPPRKDPAK